MGIRKNRRADNVDPDDLNMVPIMNMFLVLIPFLLMSASFFHIKAVNTSVPVLSNTNGGEADKPEDKLTVILELKPKELHISAMSETVTESILKDFDKVLAKKADGRYPLDKLSVYLKDIKNRFPASDTILLIPDENTEYNSIIRTMDMARKSNEQTLFPNVVLSGSLG